jgi:hypothetical protein
VDPGELDDRFLSDGTLAAQRDHWKLESFLGEDEQRRALYFEFISDQVIAFTRAGRAPDDACLRDVVVLALKRDRSYRVFLQGRGARKEIREPNAWRDLLHAGAGAILTQYARNGEP